MLLWVPLSCAKLGAREVNALCRSIERFALLECPSWPLWGRFGDNLKQGDHEENRGLFLIRLKIYVDETRNRNYTALKLWNRKVLVKRWIQTSHREWCICKHINSEGQRRKKPGMQGNNQENESPGWEGHRYDSSLGCVEQSLLLSHLYTVFV